MTNERKRNLINKVNVYRSVLILAIICIVASFLSSSFLSVNNFFNVIKQITVAGIVGCGMTFVILTGGIDLSVGSIVGLAGAVGAGVLSTTDNVALALTVTLAIGLLCGLANGFLVAQWEIPPFIATLGTMTLLRGCVLVYTKGAPIPVKNDAFKFIGKGDVLGIPLPIIILLALFLVAHFILTQTAYGRSIYAFGGNKEAARLSGIRTKMTEWGAYAFSGLTSGLAAAVLIARLGSAQATSGEGIEMDAIAAVILGGTSLSGGSGFVLSTVIGAIIMGLIDNILTLMNVNPHSTKIVKGIVVLVAVLIDKKVKDLSAKSNNK